MCEFGVSHGQGSARLAVRFDKLVNRRKEDGRAKDDVSPGRERPHLLLVLFVAGDWLLSEVGVFLRDNVGSHAILSGSVNNNALVILDVDGIFHLYFFVLQKVFKQRHRAANVLRLPITVTDHQILLLVCFVLRAKAYVGEE